MDALNSISGDVISPYAIYTHASSRESLIAPNLMSKIFVLLTVALISCTARAGWAPSWPLITTNDTDIKLLYLYHDPITTLYHIVFGSGSQYILFDFYYDQKHGQKDKPAQTRHRIDAESTYLSSVIRGAGTDLFRALAVMYNHVHTATLSESSNDGKNWTVPMQIFPKDNVDRLLQDLIYVPSMGRLFAFAVVPGKQELRMVSRARGSAVFSSEIVVGRDTATTGRWVARAGYTLAGGKLVLHVVYLTGDHRLMYSRSSTNGAVWEPARQMTQESVGHFQGPACIDGESQGVYIGYMLYGKNTTAKLVYSTDTGKSFSKPQTITKNATNSEQPFNGLAVCIVDQMEMVAGMFVTPDAGLEYTLWSQKAGAKSLYHPFKMENIAIAGADSTLVEHASLLGYVTSTDDEEFKLYLAENFPIATDDGNHPKYE